MIVVSVLLSGSKEGGFVGFSEWRKRKRCCDSESWVRLLEVVVHFFFLSLSSSVWKGGRRGGEGGEERKVVYLTTFLSATNNIGRSKD